MLLNIRTIKILSKFLGDYNIFLTASGIAKENKLNQKTVSNQLNSLEKEGLLKSKIEGRNKLFSLSLDNPSLIHILSLIEHYRTNIFFVKNPLIREVAIKIIDHSDGIVIIFGSYAKERQKKESDLDIFIVGKYNEDEIDKISELYKIDINVKHYPLSIFNKAIQKNDPLIEEVIKNHIILSGVQDFVESLKVKYYG